LNKEYFDAFEDFNKSFSNDPSFYLLEQLGYEGVEFQATKFF